MIDLGKKYKADIQDCYTLLQEYYLYEFDMKLPDVHRGIKDIRNGDALYLDNFADFGFHEVPISEIKKHDAILFTFFSGTPDHAGIYIGEQMFVHHPIHSMSKIELYDGYFIDKTSLVVRRN